jgi:hypothetical protein
MRRLLPVLLMLWIWNPVTLDCLGAPGQPVYYRIWTGARMFNGWTWSDLTLDWTNPTYLDYGWTLYDTTPVESWADALPEPAAGDCTFMQVEAANEWHGSDECGQ